MQEVTLLCNSRASASVSLASEELVALEDVRLVSKLTLCLQCGDCGVPAVKFLFCSCLGEVVGRRFCLFKFG